MCDLICGLGENVTTMVIYIADNYDNWTFLICDLNATFEK